MKKETKSKSKVKEEVKEVMTDDVKDKKTWLSVQGKVYDVDFLRNKDNEIITTKNGEKCVDFTLITTDNLKEKTIFHAKSFDNELVDNMQKGYYKKGTTLNITGYLNSATSETGKTYHSIITNSKGVEYNTSISGLEKKLSGEDKFANVSITGQVKGKGTDLENGIINVLMKEQVWEQTADGKFIPAPYKDKDGNVIPDKTQNNWKEVKVKLDDKVLNLFKNMKQYDGVNVMINGVANDGIIEASKVDTKVYGGWGIKKLFGLTENKENEKETERCPF